MAMTPNFNATSKLGINKQITVSVDSEAVRLALRKVSQDIVNSAMKGMYEVQEGVFDEANKGLLKFDHTIRRESLKGLVKKPMIFDRISDSYVLKVSQISIAGNVLENKIDTSGKGGIISLDSPNQKQAHIWIREHAHKLKNPRGTKVSPRSQISKTGPMKNVKPMQDAVDNYLEPKGIKIIADKIRNSLL